MKLAILGATGKTGTHLVDKALDAGHEVVAYVRRPEALPKRERLTAVKGELDNVDAMVRAFAGADVVISCVGPKLDLKAILNTTLMQRYLAPITRAVKQAGVDRFVLMSAFGVGDTTAKASFPARLVYKTAMASIFGDKEKAERVLPSTGLNWTAVYPVMLYEAPKLPQVTVRPIAAFDHVPGLPKIPFATVASVLLDLAGDPALSGQRLLVTA